MSQLKKGALLNYISIALTNVIGLLLTPFILFKLGDSEYGVYTTIGALVGTMSLLDFGLNNTIIRFVAKYRAEKDFKAEENFLAIIMLIYLFISFIVVVCGYIMYDYLELYFSKMSHKEITIAKNIFLIFIGNLAISLPGGAFTGICLGYEQFVFPKTLNICRYILRSIMVVGILLLGGKAIALVVLDSIFNALIIITTIIFVFNKIKVKIKLHKFDWLYLKKIFSYSIWIFIYGIVAQFQWKLGHISLGGNSDSQNLAIYAIGLMLGGYYGSFSSAITSVFLPRATKMTVDKANTVTLTNEMIKIGRISFIVLLYILSAFILFGKNFVYLWVGEQYYNSWIIALLIMIAYTIPLTQGFTGPLIEAQNKVAFKSIIYLIFLLLGTILGYYLSFIYEEIGMITGTIIGWIIAQNIMNIYYHKVLKINILRFFKELFNNLIWVQVVLLFIGMGINLLIKSFGWPHFVLKCFLYTSVYTLLMYRFGMIDYEKQLLKSILYRKF